MMQSVSPPLPAASVLIPNWNGAAFIVRCVSSALLAAREHRRLAGEETEVVVVDDASSDDSVDLLRRECPGARLIVRESNGGFSEAVNHGARMARGDALILLNSDMAVRPDFIAALLAPLREPGVFAVTAKTIDWESGAPNHLNMTARFERGQVLLCYSDPHERCDTLFLQGGAAAVRRSVFLAGGGFSKIYRPGYWEDYALSLRAVKAGWRIVYEPRAVAHHLGKASLTALHGSQALSRVVERNRLLFTWTLLTDRRMRLQHWLLMPLWVAREMRCGGGATRLRALVNALRLLPMALRERRLFPPPRGLSDSEALTRTVPPDGVAVSAVPGEA